MTKLYEQNGEPNLTQIEGGEQQRKELMPDLFTDKPPSESGSDITSKQVAEIVAGNQIDMAEIQKDKD